MEGYKVLTTLGYETVVNDTRVERERALRSHRVEDMSDDSRRPS